MQLLIVRFFCVFCALRHDCRDDRAVVSMLADIEWLTGVERQLTFTALALCCGRSSHKRRHSAATYVTLRSVIDLCSEESLHFCSTLPAILTHGGLVVGIKVWLNPGC